MPHHPVIPLPPRPTPKEVPKPPAIQHRTILDHHIASSVSTAIAPGPGRTPAPTNTPTASPSLTQGTSPHHHTPFLTHLHSIPGRTPTTIPPSTPTQFHIPTIVTNILNLPQPPPLAKTPWLFSQTQQAAEHNSRLLATFNFDVHAATQATPNSSMIYGSEFKPTTHLAPLLQHHPKWTTFKSILDNGAEYPLHPITEKERLEEITQMRAYGNHKSAQSAENAAALESSFSKEVEFQWAIPLDPAILEHIPGAQVAPLGVAIQWTVDEHNN